MNQRTTSALASLTALAILACSVGAQTTPDAKPIAVVNGEPIPAGDIDRVADMILKEKFKVQPPTEVQRRQVRMEVLHLALNNILMRQFLKKSAPKIEQAELDKHVAEFVANLQKAQPGKTLADFCKEKSTTEAQLRADMTATLQWTAYVKANVTDAAVKKYYDDSKDFFDQVAVKASHVFIQIPPKTSEGDKLAAKQKLEALRAEIVAGKLDFAEAARKHSQCPSATQGGDIGYLARKGMYEESFSRTAFALKPGEVSEVVATGFGLHLLRVTERKPGHSSDFEKIKGEVTDFYVEEMQQKMLLQERQAAKIEINLPE